MAGPNSPQSITSEQSGIDIVDLIRVNMGQWGDKDTKAYMHGTIDSHPTAASHLASFQTERILHLPFETTLDRASDVRSLLYKILHFVKLKVLDAFRAK